MMRLKLSLTALITIGFLAFVGSPAVAQELSQLQKQLRDANDAYDSGDWNTAQKMYRRALKKAPEGSELEAEAALNHSHLLWERGEYVKAGELANRALDIAENLDLKKGTGRLLLTVGHIEASRGKLQEAKNTLNICIKISKEQNNDVFASLCRLTNRTVKELLGEDVASIDAYQKDLQTIRASGSPLAAGVALAKTAELYRSTENSELAESFLKDAHSQFKRAGSKPSLLKNRLRLARLYQGQNQFEKARTQLNGLVDAFERMGVSPSLVHVYELKAADFEKRGKTTRAAKLFEKSLDAANKTDSPQLIAKARLNICEFHARHQNFADAEPACQKALKGFETTKMPSLVARTYSQLAHLAHSQSKLRKARKYYQKSISTIQTYAESSLPAFIREQANLCQVEMLLQTNTSHKQCRKALKLIDKHPDPPESMKASTYYAVGMTTKRNGTPEKAVEPLEKAAKLAVSQNPTDSDLASDAYLRLGAILAKRKESEKEALKAFDNGLNVVEKSETESGEIKKAEIEILKQKGQLLLSMKDWKEALKTLESLGEKLDDNPRVKAWTYNSIAKAQLQLGREDAAKSALQIALPLARQVGHTQMVDQIESNLEQFE